MTPSEELDQFRRREKARPGRAKTTKIIFTVLVCIIVIAFTSAFYIQSVGNKNATAYQLEIQKMRESLNAAEQKALKFEAMAHRETRAADSLSALCEQKPTKSK